MKKNAGKWTIFFFIILAVSFGVLLIGISNIMNTTSEDFDIGTLRTFDVENEQEFYFMYQETYVTYSTTTVVNITYSSNYTKIVFSNGDEMSVRIKNQTLNEYYYITELGGNFSLMINDYYAAGTVQLDPGTYEMDITMISGQSDYSIQIQSTGMVGSILMIVFSSILIVGSLIGFFVSYGIHKKQKNDDIAFDGYTYPQQNLNELFEIDDDYFNSKDNYNTDDN